MAPDGKSKAKERQRPATQPIKATRPDTTMIRGNVLTKDMAMACGMVNTDRTRIIPTALIDKDMASATNTDATEETKVGRQPERRA